MKKFLGFFLALILLAGCTGINNPIAKFEPVYAIDASAYLGAGVTFQRVKPEFYLRDKELFLVSSESELALLIAKKLEAGDDTVQYRSDRLLSLQKTYMYVESILSIPFSLSMGYTEYTRLWGSREKVYFAQVDHDVKRDAALVAGAQRFMPSSIAAYTQPKDILRILHDAIVESTTYDLSILTLDLESSRGHSSFEAEGVFNKQTAVCSGYSKAYMHLLAMRDIPALYVASLSMEHAWNLVHDGSKWKFVDTTWDDPIPDQPGRIKRTYFLLDEKAFLKDGKHHFDFSTDETLSQEEYLAFAMYVFPKTASATQ